MKSVSPLLEIKDLGYVYPDGTPALNGINFALEAGEKLAVIGANGSGKSTLLLHLAGCAAAQEGRIFLRGVHVERDLRLLRESVGLIFQEPDDQLFMPTVIDDVAFGLTARGTGTGEARGRAMDTLKTLSVGHLGDRPPHRLSGGEKRMAALAGILVMRPEILVLDEPSAALDPRARRVVIETLSGLKQSMVVATHDLDMALELCGRGIIMNGGRITADGELPGLLTNEALLLENGLELPLKFQKR